MPRKERINYTARKISGIKNDGKVVDKDYKFDIELPSGHEVQLSYNDIQDMKTNNEYFRDVYFFEKTGEEIVRDFYPEDIEDILERQGKFEFEYYIDTCPEHFTIRVTNKNIYLWDYEKDLRAKIQLRSSDKYSTSKLSNPKKEAKEIIGKESEYFEKYKNIKSITKKLYKSMPLAPYYMLLDLDLENGTEKRLEYISLFLKEPRQRTKGETRKEYKRNILAEKMARLENLGIQDILYDIDNKKRNKRKVIEDALKARKHIYAEIEGVRFVKPTTELAEEARNIKLLNSVQDEWLDKELDDIAEQTEIKNKEMSKNDNSIVKENDTYSEGITEEEAKMLFGDNQEKDKKRKISLSKTIETTKNLGKNVVEVLNKGAKKAENIYWDMRVDMVTNSTRRKTKRRERKEIREKRRDRLNTKIKRHTGINFKAIGEQCTHMKELIKESKAGHLKNKISEKYKNNKKKIWGVAIGAAAFAIAFTGISNHVVQSQSVGNTQQTQQTQLKENTFDNIESNILGNINMDKLSINEQGVQETLKQENFEEDKDIDFEDAMIGIFDLGIGSEFNMDEGEINTQANGNGTTGNYVHAKEDPSKDIECKIAGIAVIDDGNLKELFDKGETLKEIKDLYPDEQISILSAKKDGNIIGWDAKNYNKIIDRMINQKVHDLKKYFSAQEIQALIEAKETGKINVKLVEKLQQIIDEQQQGIDIDDELEI